MNETLAVTIELYASEFAMFKFTRFEYISIYGSIVVKCKILHRFIFLFQFLMKTSLNKESNFVYQRCCLDESNHGDDDYNNDF